MRKSVTKIKISKPGEDKSIVTLSLMDVFPLSCEYTEDGNLTVFCDKALYFYDENGNLAISYAASYNGVPIVCEKDFFYFTIYIIYFFF